ncbi:MAG: hypothetical protein MnENMB40S_12250 [Rhizobiaceae bacterium MnEN-MB40S]|nr:MAG: hypothetical protein MnENMB40S_12250 [Rhizobiaceae bacterium MnEN-MB40S]
MTGRIFGVDTSGGAQFTLTRQVTLLKDVHEPLSGVVIECLPLAEFISLWHRPEICEAFGAFRLKEVSLTYSVNDGKGAPAKELIVSNDL